MPVDKLALIIACIGTWITADAVASIYTYTRGDKAHGQSWLFDHSLRLLRGLLGLVLIRLGLLLLGGVN